MTHSLINFFLFYPILGRVGINTCTICEQVLLASGAVLTEIYSTINYPRCTFSPVDRQASDCGSRGWAYTLFISWNILSMVRLSFRSGSQYQPILIGLHQYIFVNMFTGEPDRVLAVLLGN